jgi:hypothetical protein
MPQEVAASVRDLPSSTNANASIRPRVRIFRTLRRVPQLFGGIVLACDRNRCNQKARESRPQPVRNPLRVRFQHRWYKLRTAEESSFNITYVLASVRRTLTAW